MRTNNKPNLNGQIVGAHKKKLYIYIYRERERERERGTEALNVGHWTIEHGEKQDLELGSYNTCTGN